MANADKSAAILTIFAAPDMTQRGRKQIAAWLRRQADTLLKEGKNYTPNRYTARYLYR